MTIFTSPRFLRTVLLADAASCIATGAAQAFATPTLARLLELPAPLLAGTGWFLLAYAAVVLATASRDPIPRALVWLFVAGNLGWALGCVALLAAGALAPSALGTGWIAVQALTVVILADLQWFGLRGARRLA